MILGKNYNLKKQQPWINITKKKTLVDFAAESRNVFTQT